MNFIERIRNCFETATGLNLLYGSREEINRAIGDGTLPVGFFTLIDTTTADGDNFAIREVGTLTIAVVDLSPNQEPGYQSEPIVEGCKTKVMSFVQRLRERKDLELQAVVRTNRIYDEFDDIVTGYSVTLRVMDLQGYTCAGMQVKTTATYTENGTYNTETIDVAVVDVPVPEIEAVKSVEPSTTLVEVFPDEGFSGIAKVNVSAVTAAIDSNITADHIVKDVTILGVTGSVEPPVYNASREWSAAHPTYDNAEDILADYTAGICYLFLGSITLTIPSNGIKYWTKDGEVTAGSEVTLECEEGKETSWLMEEYDEGVEATLSYYTNYECLGFGIKGCAVGHNGEFDQSTMPYRWMWLIGGASITALSSAGNVNRFELLYCDSSSSVNVYTMSYIVPFFQVDSAISFRTSGLNNIISNVGCNTIRMTNGNRSWLGGTFIGEALWARVVDMSTSTYFYSTSTGGGGDSLERIVFGTLTTMSNAVGTGAKCIVDFEVGDGTDCDISLANWTCTSVTADKSASLLLIANTRRHILDKVADHSGETDARTITCGWVSTLAESTDEDIQDALLMLQMDFSDKGWLLT